MGLYKTEESSSRRRGAGILLSRGLGVNCSFLIIRIQVKFIYTVSVRDLTGCNSVHQVTSSSDRRNLIIGLMEADRYPRGQANRD